jgi:hypothetical protein
VRVPVCSNSGCTSPAIKLEPRHLCAECVQDPALNGPDITDVRDHRNKKGNKRKTHGTEAP